MGTLTILERWFVARENSCMIRSMEVPWQMEFDTRSDGMKTHDNLAPKLAMSAAVSIPGIPGVQDIFLLTYGRHCYTPWTDRSHDLDNLDPNLPL